MSNGATTTISGLTRRVMALAGHLENATLIHWVGKDFHGEVAEGPLDVLLRWPRVGQHPVVDDGVHRAEERQREEPEVLALDLAALEPAPDAVALVQGQGGIQPRGGDALLAQRLHLVAHERDQRRHHQAHAGPDQGRDLVADALAAAGGQAHDGAAADRRNCQSAFL